jgi:hydrogenase maturation protease
MTTLAPVLVLGLGNDILTDDAVGLHVARAVRSALTDEPDIAVEETTEMGLTLLDSIADREGLVLIDAVQTCRAPAGHIHEFGPAELAGVLTTSPHFLGVGETLALGRSLGVVMPHDVRILAIEVADPLTLGERLTPKVAAAVEEAAGRVARIARGFAAQVRARYAAASFP